MIGWFSNRSREDGNAPRNRSGWGSSKIHCSTVWIMRRRPAERPEPAHPTREAMLAR